MITSSRTWSFFAPISLASMAYSQKSGVRRDVNTGRALARPHKRPALLEFSIFPRTFDPRGMIGGLFRKNRTSAATVKSNGPEVVPATMCSSGYTRIIVPAGMFIEQDVSLGPAKPVELRHDKPRKTAARNVLFVAFILAFLFFHGVSHFKDPRPTRCWWVDRHLARRMPIKMKTSTSVQQQLGKNDH